MSQKPFETQITYNNFGNTWMVTITANNYFYCLDGLSNINHKNTIINFEHTVAPIPTNYKMIQMNISFNDQNNNGLSFPQERDEYRYYFNYIPIGNSKSAYESTTHTFNLNEDTKIFPVNTINRLVIEPITIGKTLANSKIIIQMFFQQTNHNQLIQIKDLINIKYNISNLLNTPTAHEVDLPIPTKSENTLELFVNNLYITSNDKFDQEFTRQIDAIVEFSDISLGFEINYVVRNSLIKYTRSKIYISITVDCIKNDKIINTIIIEGLIYENNNVKLTTNLKYKLIGHLQEYKDSLFSDYVECKGVYNSSIDKFRFRTMNFNIKGENNPLDTIELDFELADYNPEKYRFKNVKLSNYSSFSLQFKEFTTDFLLRSGSKTGEIPYPGGVLKSNNNNVANELFSDLNLDTDSIKQKFFTELILSDFPASNYYIKTDLTDLTSFKFNIKFLLYHPYPVLEQIRNFFQFDSFINFKLNGMPTLPLPHFPFTIYPYSLKYDKNIIKIYFIPNNYTQEYQINKLKLNFKVPYAVLHSMLPSKDSNYELIVKLLGTEVYYRTINRQNLLGSQFIEIYDIFNISHDQRPFCFEMFFDIPNPGLAKITDVSLDINY